MNTKQKVKIGPIAKQLYSKWREFSDESGGATVSFNGLPAPYKNAWLRLSLELFDADVKIKEEEVK